MGPIPVWQTVERHFRPVPAAETRVAIGGTDLSLKEIVIRPDLTNPL